MVLSKIQEKEIVEKYLLGSSTYGLAIEYNVSPHPITDILKRHNIQRRPASIPTDVQLILLKYNSGILPKQIAKDLGISNRIVYKHLNNNDIFLNKTYDADKEFFKTIDTPEKAYWLGFCYADLYVFMPYSVQLMLGKKDIQHLEKFKQSLHAEHPIKPKIVTHKNGKQYLEYRICIGSKEMVFDLIDKGCIQCKGDIIDFPPPNVPTELLPFFVTGYFDGDGSIFCDNKDKAWRTEIACNYQFGIHLQEYLMKNCNLNKTKLQEEPGVWKICYGGNFQAARIGHFLYDNTVICLDRKKKEFEKLYYFLEHRIPQKRITEDQIKQITEWYKNGMSMAKIAKNLGINHWSVRNHLKKQGIFNPQRSQNYVRHQYDNGFKTYVNDGSRLNKNAH
jgi:DNA-binding CsgD family transcriptional regulator